MLMLDRYSDAVNNLVLTGVEGLPDTLLMEKEGRYSVYYAPFDYINTAARVVICGITPGLSQARIALTTAQGAMREGKSTVEADYNAKQTASFAGSMRSNLADMLDYLQVNDVLGVQSCADLFGKRADAAHYTSVLRYPVFRDGKNYSGSSAITKTPILRRQVEGYLADELSAFPEATLIVPLGANVEAALMLLVNRGVINEAQVLRGLLHPSGANNERISYFLERKCREDLSDKTNPETIDEGKLLAKRSLEAFRTIGGGQR